MTDAMALLIRALLIIALGRALGGAAVISMTTLVSV